MILHPVSMLAGLVGQIAQAPVVVQCAQPAAEPEWKWWFTALAPWVGPLLSCVVSIYVAWKVFNWQGRKDREQWIRDQRKAEWSCLLRSVASVYQITNSVGGTNRRFAERIVSELEPALKEVSIARANCVFIDEFRLNNEGCKKTMEFLRFSAIQLQKIRGNLGLFDSINDRIEKAGSATDEDTKRLSRGIKVHLSHLSDIERKSSDFLAWLQKEAALDLIQTAEGEEHWAMRWEKRLNFTRKKTGS